MVAAEELEKNGHTQQAIQLYEKARNNDPSLKSVSHHLAVLYDAQGDSTRSLAEYNKALACDPKNANLLSDVGYYYYERDNFAEAERSLRKALAIDPNHQKALYQSWTGSCRPGAVRREFRGFLESKRPRRGPFQCRRSDGQARTIRRS